jgi:hypothetical protein
MEKPPGGRLDLVGKEERRLSACVGFEKLRNCLLGDLLAGEASVFILVFNDENETFDYLRDQIDEHAVLTARDVKMGCLFFLCFSG